MRLSSLPPSLCCHFTGICVSALSFALSFFFSFGYDRYEYLFKFDSTFEIHDDIEVLKRMGMALGLERGTCTPENLAKAVKMVPKVLEPYVQGKFLLSRAGATTVAMH